MMYQSRSLATRFSLISVLLLAMPVAAPAQNATTVQLPTFGVAVDADGVLRMKTFADPGGRLHAARIAAAKGRLPGDVTAWSDVRKISLRRLEAAIERTLAAGEKPDDILSHLAGLQRVQYVFFLPDERDVVLAGPAEGFVPDGAGRAVGITTGKPVILLDDLLVALRVFAPGTGHRPFVGCTIDPSPDGLKRLTDFQKTIPRAIPQRARPMMAGRIAKGMNEALGSANVRVFGVPPNTHFAQVLVEADYRMKLIGIGLEPPPVKMVTFASALKSAQHGGLQRWWFTPDYACVRVTTDRTAMELVGQGVQLQSEDKVIGPGGRLVNSAAPPNPASELFTLAFTRKFPEIASVRPVYAQLRNMIDLTIVAAFLRSEDYYGRAGWDARLLGDAGALPAQTASTPKKAPCAVNSFWKGSRLYSAAGGGVSILPLESLKASNLLPDEGDKLAGRAAQTKRAIPADRWWWD
jgi:hypothetical protein